MMTRQNNILEYLKTLLMYVPTRSAMQTRVGGICIQAGLQLRRAIRDIPVPSEPLQKAGGCFHEKTPEDDHYVSGRCLYRDYYVPIDEKEMPVHRIRKLIFASVPEAVICDETTKDKIRSFNYDKDVYLYDEIIKSNPDDGLQYVFDKAIDTDPIYVVFTSGSTGVPKGVVACHRSVIDYIESFSDVLRK